MEGETDILYKFYMNFKYLCFEMNAVTCYVLLLESVLFLLLLLLLLLVLLCLPSFVQIFY